MATERDKEKNTDERPALHTSMFRLYSMGTAAENLVPGTTILECYPIEALPYRNGEINGTKTPLVHSGKDAFGNDYSVKVDTANTVKAEWCPFRSNLLTAPCIRRGEHVAILQYADADKFYWVERGRLDDLGLRRLETVVWGFSNTRDETVKVLDASNSWLMEVSTHTKQASFRTNKSDGEKFAYLIQVNAKAGNVTVMDDAGQWWQLNSAARRMEFHNSDGSEVIIDKKDLTINGVDTITSNTKKYTVNCDDYILNASNSITTKTKTYSETALTYNMNAQTSYTITTATYSLTATDAINLTSEMLLGTIVHSTLTGMLNVMGVTSIQGLLTLAGGIAAIAGSGPTPPTAHFATPADFTNGIKANGVPVDETHTHTSTTPGNPTSTPRPA